MKIAISTGYSNPDHFNSRRKREIRIEKSYGDPPSKFKTARETQVHRVESSLGETRVKPINSRAQRIIVVGATIKGRNIIRSTSSTLKSS